MNYQIIEDCPTNVADIESREILLKDTQSATEEYGLETEAFSATEEGQGLPLQGIFVYTLLSGERWCVGAIVRLQNGELRSWPRNSEGGPVSGSIPIVPEKLPSVILEMVEECTAL